jgi:hypothetical protein
VPASPPLLGSTGSTTLVLAIALVALGAVMLVAAVWLVRATRTDPPVLGPLEVMGDRRFAKRDPQTRAALLAAARPPGAWDPAPMVPIEDELPDEPSGDAGSGANVADLLALLEPASSPAVNGDAGSAVAGTVPAVNGDAAAAGVVDAEPVASATLEAPGDADAAAPEPVDAEIVDAEIVDAEIVDAEVIDAAPAPAAAEEEILDATLVEDGEVADGATPEVADDVEPAPRSS